MNTNQKNLLLSTIVAILVAGGTIAGSDLLTSAEYSNAYVCSVTEEIGFFEGGISSTAYTGYPFADSRIGYVRCINGDEKGIWISLDSYLDSLNITQARSQRTAPEKGYRQYSCDTQKCIRLI